MSQYSFREQDCLVCVDRSQQVLRVEIREEASWWRYRDQIPRVTVDEDLPLLEASARASEESDATDERYEVEPMPSSTIAQEVSGGTVPLMAFSQKAKLFDDWLYATLDTATFLGDAPALGKQAFVHHLRAQLMSLKPSSNPSAMDVVAMLCAAEQLGSGQATRAPHRQVSAELPLKLRLKVKQRLKAFHSDSKQSRPIGVYSESELLRRIFQHDRILQDGFAAEDARTLATAIAQLNLEDAYQWHLQCSKILTGPFAIPSVLESLQREATPQDKYALFPPSQAPETELVKRLYGDRPIPDGFCLIDELIIRAKDGRLDLTPSDQDGWYLRQLYALDALLHPENERLKVGPRYGQCLDELFKGLLSLSRETHIKQLEIPAVGMGIPEFIISPRLRVEPMPAYYDRMAQSYGWLLNQLINLWGESALTQQVCDRHNRPTCILDALTDMGSLFAGAAHLCREDLGLSQGALTPAQRQAVSYARKFVATWTNDPDIQVDCRMMVPLYYDEKRQCTRVSVVCGFLSEEVNVEFDQRPSVQVTNAFGQPIEVRLDWQDSRYVTVFPVQFECDVKEVCDRDTLRQLANQYPNPQELKNVLEV